MEGDAQSVHCSMWTRKGRAWTVVYGVHSGQCLAGRPCKVWDLKCGAQSVEGSQTAEKCNVI